MGLLFSRWYNTPNTSLPVPEVDTHYISNGSNLLHVDPIDTPVVQEKSKYVPPPKYVLENGVYPIKVDYH